MFKKVLAHPENRLPPDLWSVEEQGNYLADRVAGGFVEPSITIQASKWLRHLSSYSKISLVDENKIPIIRDVKNKKSKLDVQQYLEDRDSYRADKDKDSIWVGANIAFHHKLLGERVRLGTEL